MPRSEILPGTRAVMLHGIDMVRVQWGGMDGGSEGQR